MRKLFLTMALFLGMSFSAMAEDLELGKTYSYEQVEGSYDDIYADFSYEATEDGVLVFTSDCSLSGYVSIDGGDETYVNFSSPDYTNYFLKQEVKAGSTYDFTFKYWKSYEVSAELTHPVAGSDYDVAFQPQLGAQTLPAAAGTWWYKVNPGKAGYLHVSSTESLIGGKVTIASVGYDGSPSTWTCKEGDEGVFEVSMEVDSYSSYFVKVVKATATDTDQTFTIAWEDYPEGYSDSNPIMIGELPFNGSAPVGTTYFGVTISKEDAGNMLLMSATRDLTSDWSNCSAYPQSNSYDQTYGDASVEVVTKEGVMILKWVNYDEEDIPFTVSVKALLPGQTIETPISAGAGDNDFPAAGTWFYTYTASKDGKLIVTPSDASIKVSFPKGSGPYDGNWGFSKAGDDYSIAVVEGQSYLLKFEYTTDESWFTIAEGEFQQGEVRENPITVEGDTYTFGTAQSVWIAYTVQKDGKLTITCDAEPSYSNSISVWTPGATYAESLSSYDDNYNMIYSKTIMVKAGDVILVNPVMANNEAGKQIIFTMAEPLPGETFGNPLMAQMETKYDVPSINYGSPFWFKLHLTPGDYRFYASDYIGAYYYDSEAKALADEEDYLDGASLGNQDEDGDSYFAFIIAEETDVYFKITRSWGAFKAWFKDEAAQPHTLDIVLGAGGYSTVAASSNFTLPEGVEAYYATVSSGKVFLHKVDADVIAAGEGVILKGTEGATVKLNITDEDAETILDNQLVGVTDASTFVNNGNVYVISTQNGETAFYKYTADSFPAGKAYLNAEGANGAKMVASFGDETTIAGVESAQSQTIYNLQGQRLHQTQKGINIIGGKKVIVE